MFANGEFKTVQQAVINTLLLKRDIFSFLDTLANENEKVIFVPLVEGGFWLVNHPDAVKRVLLANDDEITKPEFLLQSNRGRYGDGLTSLTGERWKARRIASARALTPAVMERVLSETRAASDVLLNKLAQLASESEALIEIAALIFELVVEISARWILSSRIVDHAQGDGIPKEEALGAWHHLKVVGVAGDLMPSTRLRANETPVLREIIRKKWCQSDAETPTDFIGAFYSSCKAQGLDLTDEEVFDEIIQLLFAPYHTVTTTLLNCIYFLDQYPYNKQTSVACLTLSVSSVCHVEPKKNKLESKSIEYFIKEVMRFCMPTTLLFREVSKTLELEGKTLSANDLIVISPYLLHQDRRWFAQPRNFMPERFGGHINNYAYLPFGAGHRRCVVHKLALAQMTVVIEAFIKCIDITPITTLPKNLFSLTYPENKFYVKINRKHRVNK